ncbi:MAG: hypothetical protein HYR49_00720 [Gammaproteobacteria bacterium]|nr:hypothetical protein [Gammaproteobacteria bacterium]
MSTRPRRLTVHIGAPKTGSTYLQRLLHDNRHTLLRDQDILYPDVSLRGFGHHDLAFLLAGGYPEWAIPQEKTLPTLTAELRSAAAGHHGDIILSSEDFYLFPNPDGLRRLLQESGALAGRLPCILVYVRRQDDVHESWYNQTVKAQGESHSLEACLEKYFSLWDYAERLAQWTGVFGREALCVRSYDLAVKSAAGLCGDFLLQVGIDASRLVIPPQEVNWSLNRDLLKFQRWLNRLPLAPVHRRRFHRQLMELDRHAAGRGWFDERPLLTAADRRRIMAGYSGSNAALGRDHMGGAEAFPGADADGIAESAAETGSALRKLCIIVNWLWRHG